MKKLLLLLVCLFTFQAVVKANDDKPIKVAQLPQSAQQFIINAVGNDTIFFDLDSVESLFDSAVIALTS